METSGYGVNNNPQQQPMDIILYMFHRLSCPNLVAVGIYKSKEKYSTNYTWRYDDIDVETYVWTTLDILCSYVLLIGTLYMGRFC